MKCGVVMLVDNCSNFIRRQTITEEPGLLPIKDQHNDKTK